MYPLHLHLKVDFYIKYITFSTKM